MSQVYQTDNVEQTRALAEQMAQRAEQQENGRALVLALTGELGSGKTTFVQAFAQALGVEDKILSPTFVILKKFPVPGSSFDTLYHIDCYRLQSKELLKLGFEEIISQPRHLVMIEWADKVEQILPPHHLNLNFEVTGKNEREINVKMK